MNKKIKNNTIYNIFKQKEKISDIIPCSQGYDFSFFNEKMSLTSVYSEVFNNYVFLLEFLVDAHNDDEMIIASFQNDLEEDAVLFGKLYKYLEERGNK